MKATLISVCFGLSAVTSAFGWNKPGHMLTGSVAYLELTQTSSATVGKVVAILKAHPSYATWEKAIKD